MKKTIARKYTSKNKTFEVDYDFYPRGGGGLFSSAHDLIRYGLFHLKTPLKDQKSILTNETLDFTHKADNPDLPNYHRYNLGWGIVNDGQNLSLISDGRIGGANSMLLLLPEQKIAVACISNMTGGITMMTAIQIVDMLIPGYMKNIMNFIEPMGAVENLRVPFKVEPKLEGEWQGEIKTYQGKIPITMTFADDASVTAKIGNQPVAQVMDLNFVDQPDTVVNHIKFFYRILTGTINSTIPTPDAGKGEHTISLKLRYVNGNLVGSGTAIGEGFALPSFIKLSRKR